MHRLAECTQAATLSAKWQSMATIAAQCGIHLAGDGAETCIWSTMRVLWPEADMSCEDARACWHELATLLHSEIMSGEPEHGNNSVDEGFHDDCLSQQAAAVSPLPSEYGVNVSP